MQASPIVLTTLAGLSTGLGGLLAVLCPPSERLLATSAGFGTSRWWFVPGVGEVAEVLS